MHAPAAGRRKGRGLADDDAPIDKTCTVQNKMGLHARPAALLVQTANRFACDVTLEKDGQTVNGKSIMGVLMLAAAKGSTINIKAEGEAAHECVQAISELFDKGFNEQ
jgi:phosphocarrier protein